MKPILFVILFALVGPAARAQEFAFVPGFSGSESPDRLGGYKKAVAQKVFETLLHARGDYRLQPPTLVLSKRMRNMAAFNPDQVEIILEEKAYDVCASFGKDSLNALAALLAHELTHYYEKHDWSRHFVRENENLETARRLENLEEGLKQEAQADCLGGFMAFSAGYNTYGIMPELLRKLYKTYELPDDLPGYPSLAERLKMVDGAMEQLKNLQIVFETANLLTLLGQYADAAGYYRHILQTYQSREIFNNAGVNAVLAALNYAEPTLIPYVLPLELDPKSRLLSVKNNDQEKAQRKSNLLKTAMEHFERALLLDENYGPAYLNKACVLVLNGDWEEAEYALRKGRKKNAAASDYDVLEGVAAALQKDSLAAVKHWERAQKQGNNWAAVNLQILQKTPRPAPATAAPVKGIEEIEQFPLTDFLSSPVPDVEVKVADKVYCGFKQLSQSRLFIHYANLGKQYAVLQETLPNYTGKTLRGIALNDPQEKITAAYGNSPRQIALTDGSVWLYPGANLYFKLTSGAKVSAWGVYRKSDL